MIGLLVVASKAVAEQPAGFDAARSFGALPSVLSLSLSPDGKHVAYLASRESRTTVLYTASTEGDAKPRAITHSDGKPYRLTQCSWVSNERLVCQLYGIVPDPSVTSRLLPVSRLLAVNADGSNPQALAAPRNIYSRGYLLHDGEIIDLLPDENGAVLMSRMYTPDSRTGSHVGTEDEGLGVDRVDTQTLAVKHVISPRADAFEFLSDGRGTVRVLGAMQKRGDGYATGVLKYAYRPRDSTDWKPLCDFDENDGSGFQPVAVDHDLDVAYGFRKSDGRVSLYAKKLDESLQEQLVFARPDVDVSGVLQIGRRQRVVGATFVTDRRQSEVFDPEIRRLLASVSRALPQQPLIDLTDSSVDEATLLLRAGSDSDPGVYYLFDRNRRSLATYLVVRDQLENVRLAKVTPVTYPSNDGVPVPAYLTLPPGQEGARGLPAIVLPHGGPSARDEWGFDWLAQYYANRGYAVLQPNFRGSTGYGDAWFQQNGFRSWRVAIGDVLAAGRWLAKEGIADPSRIAVVGWSYGGYAALQSAATDPSVFKAVIAIAPVTDLAAVANEWKGFTNYAVVKASMGDGANLREGSPVEHASSIKAPVLLFHGMLDRNVGYQHSERMADQLKAAGAKVELVTFPDLDHQLEDSSARAEMLQRSDEFLRAAFH